MGGKREYFRIARSLLGLPTEMLSAVNRGEVRGEQIFCLVRDARGNVPPCRLQKIGGKPSSGVDPQSNCAAGFQVHAVVRGEKLAAFEPAPAVHSGYQNSRHSALLEGLTSSDSVYGRGMLGRMASMRELPPACRSTRLAAKLSVPPQSSSRTRETRGRGEACVPRPFPWAPLPGSSSRP